MNRDRHPCELRNEMFPNKNWLLVGGRASIYIYNNNNITVNPDTDVNKEEKETDALILKRLTGLLGCHYFSTGE